MNEEKNQEREQLIKKIKRFAISARNAHAAEKFDRVLELCKQGEKLIESFQGNVPKELESSHLSLLWSKVGATLLKGYFTRSLKYAKEYLTISEKYDNKISIAWALAIIGEYYYNTGNNDKALEFNDRAMKIMEEVNDVEDFDLIFAQIYILSRGVGFAIEKGDLGLARIYFEHLEGVYERDPKNAFLTGYFKMAKAELLRAGKRTRDMAKAEELLKEVIEGKLGTGYWKTLALLNLCELLLEELKMTGEMEILDEIMPLVEKIIHNAQKSESDIYLTHAYILQGKVALLTFDIKTARRFLIQAQRIAERRGYNAVADEIKHLHEDLVGKLDTWERLKEINAPLSERIKLARLDEHIDGQFRKKLMKMERVMEEEVTVYKVLQSCLVCKGNVGGFNIYVCPKCNSIYCRICAEAVVEIENACWNCETPIDASKPVKLYDSKRGAVKIDEKNPKKSKSPK